MKVRLLLLLFFWLPFMAHADSDVVYVSSIKAKLLAEPKFKADEIVLLEKGEQLKVVNQKGAWLQVQTPDQQTGWLSKFLTKPTPPNDRITVLPGDEETQLKDVRRRTSTITTAAAARGLADVETATKEDLYVSDPAAVEYMESLQQQITPRELKAFSNAITEGAE